MMDQSVQPADPRTALKTGLTNYFSYWAQTQGAAGHLRQTPKETLWYEMAGVIRAAAADVCSWLDNSSDDAILSVVLDVADAVDPAVAELGSLVVDALKVGCVILDAERKGARGTLPWWVWALGGAGLAAIILGASGGSSKST